MSEDALLYKVALSMVPGIGGVLARTLITYVGSVEGIFRESEHALMKIPGIGEVHARSIRESNTLGRAAEELVFADKNEVRVSFYLDEGYPRRFLQCADAPILFYFRGNGNLDAGKIISIVGTRRATGYGRQMCEELIRDLAGRGYDLLVVSGLAYGIDIQAHSSSLKYGVPTVGVLAHGLDMLYPAEHARTAEKMRETGGLLTDFPSKTRLDPPNFIRRNRLIAGLSDATVVVESGEKGGALITADIADSYHHDVCAFPGRANDSHSKGCNMLIKKNLAVMIENAEDLEYALMWDPPLKKQEPLQPLLFAELTSEEERVTGHLSREEKTSVDTLAGTLEMPISKITALLLDLECKGVVISLPGNRYRLR